MTRARRLLSTAMTRTSSSVKPGEQPVGHDGQPVLDRRVERLAEIAGEHGVLAYERRLPGHAGYGDTRTPARPTTTTVERV